MAAPILGKKEKTSFLSCNVQTVSPSQPKSDTHSRICICLLCGLPGSGKTTLLRTLTGVANNYTQSAVDTLEPLIVGIEYDARIPHHSFAFDGDSWWQEEEVNGKWKRDRAQMVLAVEAIMQQIQCNHEPDMPQMTKPNEVDTEIWQQFSDVLDFLNSRRKNNKDEVVLVIDDNMYFRSMRYDYYKLARRYCTGYCQVYVRCCTETAMRRNRGRETIRQVSDDVILRMSGKLEPPDPAKNSWETNSITVNSDMDADILISSHEILKLIKKVMMNPEQPQNERNEEQRSSSRVECSMNKLHQADLILRKCVATKMANSKVNLKPEQLKELSRCVFQAKEKVLRDLKDGHHSLMVFEDLNIANSAQNPDSGFFVIVKDLFLMELSKS